MTAEKCFSLDTACASLALPVSDRSSDSAPDLRYLTPQNSHTRWPHPLSNASSIASGPGIAPLCCIIQSERTRSSGSRTTATYTHGRSTCTMNSPKGGSSNSFATKEIPHFGGGPCAPLRQTRPRSSAASICSRADPRSRESAFLPPSFSGTPSTLQKTLQLWSTPWTSNGLPESVFSYCFVVRSLLAIADEHRVDPPPL